MKCPKCGFNSFEYYDSCKKCATDLVGFKQTYSITSLVLPLEAKEKLADEFLAAEGTASDSAGTTENHDDIFAFDLPDISTDSASDQGSNPFDFDEPAPADVQFGGLSSEEDAFANLLESTSQEVDSPFASAMPDSATTPAAAPLSGPGEFDLESFSWDDTPVATAESEGKAGADDFDSLFGDTKEDSPK